MALHIAIEVVTEEIPVVVKIEVEEEISKLVELKDNNPDNLTDLIQAKTKQKIRARWWDYLSSRYNHNSRPCK